MHSFKWVISSIAEYQGRALLAGATSHYVGPTAGSCRIRLGCRSRHQSCGERSSLLEIHIVVDTSAIQHDLRLSYLSHARLVFLSRASATITPQDVERHLRWKRFAFGFGSRLLPYRLGGLYQVLDSNRFIHAIMNDSR